EAGEPEAAMTPLFRALSVTAAGRERLDETRTALTRALEEIVDARSVDIAALVDAGDTGLAALQGDKLWGLLRGAVDDGLPQEHLTDAFARVAALFHRMGRPRSTSLSEGS